MLATQSLATIEDIIDHLIRVPSCDVLAYRISRVAITPPKNLTLNRPMRIVSLVPTAAIAHAADALLAVGVKIGYAAVDRAMGTYTSMHECPPTFEAATNFPEIVLRHHEIVPYAIVSSIQQLLQAQTIAMAQAAATWYLETQQHPNEELEMLGQSTSSDSGGAPDTLTAQQGLTTHAQQTQSASASDHPGQDPFPKEHASTDPAEQPALTQSQHIVATLTCPEEFADDPLITKLWHESRSPAGYTTPASDKHALTVWEIPTNQTSQVAYLEKAQDVIETFAAAHPRHNDVATGQQAMNTIAEQRRLNMMRSESKNGVDRPQAAPPNAAVPVEHAGSSEPPGPSTSGGVQAITTSSMTGPVKDVSQWPELTITHLPQETNSTAAGT
jgi:hypothetical protein